MAKKVTKRAIVASLLSLSICTSMLIGSTYAWFTDSVTSSGNIIKSGTLQVGMNWANGKENLDEATWNDVEQDGIDPMFYYDLWEPGYVQARHIQVFNKGSLALKYNLTILPAENSNYDPDAEDNIASVIDVYFYDPAQPLSDRAELTDANKIGTLKDLIADPTILAADTQGHLSAKAAGEADYPNKTVTLALKMQETAGNEYQDKEISAGFDVKLFATQWTEEKDTFDELYDKWLDQFAGGRKPWMQLWPYDLPEWIKRDRNHPSVIMWSLGNELQTYANLPFEDWGVTPYRMMKPVVQRYDPTRKITVAMHPRGRSLETDSIPAPLVFETDIAAYNYRYMYFDGDGRKYPWMVFYQSEANTSNMGPNFFEMNQDKVIGLAYWGQIDYLGESQGWPAKGWAQGAFDLSLQPKPIAYLLRSMFSDEPVVHIGVIDDDKSDVVWNDVQVGTARMSENWNRKPDTKATINVYTNCDKVVLRLNGKVVAEKENTLNTKGRNKLRIDDIMYQPGTLEAIGYKDGKPVASHKIMTAGKIQRLNLEADNNNWLADGKDLQHIRVTAVDKKGNKVWSANQQLTFEVVGDAKIVGVDNGDITSEELTVGNTRRLFNGSALVILRAGKNAGKVQLKVSSPDLKTQIIKLTTN